MNVVDKKKTHICQKGNEKSDMQGYFVQIKCCCVLWILVGMCLISVESFVGRMIEWSLLLLPNYGDVSENVRV